MCFALFSETLPAWFENCGRSHKKPDYDKLNWACDFCLERGHALLANPQKQRYCDHWPHYAYRDRKHPCSDCGESFMVEAWEQKFWYETLRFWVQSFPKCCKSCYKKREIRRAIAHSDRRMSSGARNNNVLS